MRTRWKVALLIPFAALLPMLMGPSGGIPSAPQFVRVGIAKAPPSGAFSALDVAGNAQLLGAAPSLLINNTSAAVDNRLWSFQGTGGQLNCSTVNDAISLSRNWCLISRSGLAVTTVALGNATDNPAYSFLGTGTATFGGNVTASLSRAIFTANSTTTTTGPLFQFQVAGVRKGFFAEAANTNDFCNGTVAGDVCIGASSGSVLVTRNDGATTSAVCTADGTGCPVAASSTTSTGTAVGLTTSPTATFRFTKIGNMVVMSNDGGLGGTSNSTSFSVTGAVPAGYQPSRTQVCPARAVDNGTNITAYYIVSAASSTLTLIPLNAATLWTGSGTKSFDTTGGLTCTYSLL